MPAGFLVDERILLKIDKMQRKGGGQQK